MEKKYSEFANEYEKNDAYNWNLNKCHVPILRALLAKLLFDATSYMRFDVPGLLSARAYPRNYYVIAALSVDLLWSECWLIKKAPKQSSFVTSSHSFAVSSKILTV